MAASFNKEVDNDTKSLVYGFTQIILHEISMDVPPEIIDLILMFYWIQEMFTAHGEDLLLDDKNEIKFELNEIMERTMDGILFMVKM